MKVILETQRLYLREMEEEDYDSLCEMLQDKDVMYAYEHPFDDAEVRDWLNRNFKRYETYGFGLWAVILKENGELIGQCGLTMQECIDRQVLEIGYLFKKAYWHRGYATEAAIACKDYAFNTLNAKEVFSIIRDNNKASQNVAIRNGMKVTGRFTKHYYGMDMPHLVFQVQKHAKGI